MNFGSSPCRRPSSSPMLFTAGRLMPLHQDLFVEANPIPVKWACKALGLMATDTLRLPMTPLSEAARPVVERALKSVGLL